MRLIDHLVIRYPLEHRVCKQEIDLFRRCPGFKIGLNENALWQPQARLPQHILRRIQSDHGGVRKAILEKFRRITGSATQIDRDSRPLQRHLRQQIAGWPRPVVFKLQILACVPVAQ